MDKIPQEQIEDAALEVVEASGVTKPVVNAVAIAEMNGITVKEVDMPPSYKDVAGFFNEAEMTIYVAKDDKPTRQLFTVAHELGHYFLGHKHYSVLLRITNKEKEYPISEQQANSFAAHLLMPEFLVKEYMKKYNFTRANYKEMAEIFGVPISAMKARFDYLRP